jgi:2-methylisocitrate lyase-like PEP mutase family enzyme
VQAGFVTWEAFAVTSALTHRRDGWRGRVRASAGVAPVMDAETLTCLDAAMQAEQLGTADSLPVGHKVVALAALRG